MTPNPFEHEPLENVFKALGPDSEGDQAELRKSLISRGYNPEKTAATVSAKVEEFLKQNTISWREIAKQKQARFDQVRANLLSWTKRRKEEIEEAFSQVQSGNYGPAAQMKLQVAFRNLKDVPLEDQATFLDDIETLRLMTEKSPDEGSQ